MNQQERREGFVRAIQMAEQQFGMTLIATLQPEMLGPVLQAKPVLSIAEIPNWVPVAERSPHNPTELTKGT